MASLNSCNFIGRVGKAPEIRTAGSTTIASFSIACDEKYKNKDGELVEKTEWINIVFFGKLAQIVEQYVDKGKELFISGRMTTEKYTDKNGVEKYATKIIGEKMQMLGGKGEGKPQQSQVGDPAFPDDSEIPF